MEHRVGPHIGAKIVAHAWTDAAYKKRLLTQPDAAIAELGVDTRALGTHMMVLENTPRVHNMVVCTLCSCYPISVLGLPPVWYKSTAYRARAVSDPRGVLHDFGLSLADDVEIRVWDSSAELRFLVLPERPAGTEHMSEAELTALITRDSMIGTGIVTYPPKYPTKTAATEGKSAASEHDG
jgi:nitrile hydratase